MLVKRFHYVFRELRIVALVGLLLILLSIIPVRLAIAFGTALCAIAQFQAPNPQAILTLGGGQDREEFTAQFAQNHPFLDIWVSSGIPPNNAREISHAAGIRKQRVHLDYRASDTVTNFTSLHGRVLIIAVRVVDLVGVFQQC